MKRTILLTALAAVGTAAHATWFTSEASFQAAISALKYTEDFSGFTFGSPLDGSQTTWAAPGANGFGWTASATGGLYSNVSALSTNSANDPLTITNTGAAITAFGGLVCDTDITGAKIAGTTTLTINGGADSMGIANGAGQEVFLGYVGVPITSVSILSTSTATNNWPQIDHLIVGNAVPEPASMVALGVGALAMIRRRRSK